MQFFLGITHCLAQLTTTALLTIGFGACIIGTLQSTPTVFVLGLSSLALSLGAALVTRLLRRFEL